MLNNIIQPKYKILVKGDKVTAGIFILYFFRTCLYFKLC